MNRYDEWTATENDRLREVARILAAGVLRLHARAVLPAKHHDDQKNLPESARKGLEVSDESPLSVSHGS